MSSRRTLLYAALAAICLFAVVMRGSFVLTQLYIAFDAKKRYVPQATNLLAGNGFSKSIKAPYIADTTEHNPGYSFFLAGAYFVSNSNLRFVVFVQLILELSTIYLTWLIGGLLPLQDRAKRLAIITALLCPLLARWTRAHGSEILATFFITLALYFVVLSVKRDRIIFWMAAGVASACSWFVRMDQILIIILFILSSALITRKIAKPLLLALTFFVAASPWIIRNYGLTGKFQPIGDLSTKSKLPQVRWADSWITEMKDYNRYALSIKSDPTINYKKLTEQERRKGRIRLYVVVPTLRLINVLKDGLTAQLSRRPEWMPARVFAYCTVILGILGIAISIYRREWILVLPFCLIVGRWILPMMTAVAMQFRILVESLPAIFLFAGIAADSIYETARRFIFERRAGSLSTQESPLSGEASDV